MTACPPRDALLAAYLGPHTPYADLAAHVEQCPQCQRLLDDALAGDERALVAACPLLLPPADPPAAPTLPAAPAIPGYDLLEILGRGGTGVVYKARQLSVNRLVAVKVLVAGGHAADGDRARFLREAQILARLAHPHLVGIHDAGTHDGLPFLVMELVEGTTLAQRLAGHPLPPRDAAALVQTLARALAAAHAAQVIHCDLKPANVLLVGGDVGRPRLADFGLARFLDAQPGSRSSGTMAGTPAYMAPEQVTERRAALGPHTDVYGLGAVLYECLTGRPPHQGTSRAEVLQQVLAEEPLPPGRVYAGTPRDLETVCLKCLCGDPGRRYGSAEALAADLGRYLSGEPVAARPAGAVERLVRLCRRNPSAATWFGLFLAAVAAGLAGMGYLWRSEAAHARQAEKLSGDLRQMLAGVADLVEGKATPIPMQAISARRAQMGWLAERYVGLASQHPTDAGLAAGAARFLAREGEVLHQLRQLEEALDRYRQARAWWATVPPSHLTSRDNQVERARCLSGLGTVAIGLGDNQGIEPLSDAARLWDAVAGELVDERDMMSRAVNLQTIAQVLQVRGKPAEARQAFERAVSWLDACCRDHPSSAQLHVNRLEILDSFGSLLDAQKHHRAAVQTWQRGYEMISARPGLVAMVHLRLTCRMIGRPDIEPYYAQALQLAEPIWKDGVSAIGADPLTPCLNHALLALVGVLIEAHHKANHPNRAREAVARLNVQLGRFYAGLPDADVRAVDAATVLVQLAEFQSKCDQRREGLRNALRASEFLRRWIPHAEAHHRPRLKSITNWLTSVLADCGARQQEIAEVHECLVAHDVVPPPTPAAPSAAAARTASSPR